MKVRKEEQVDAFRQKILTATKDIIQKEGIEHVSMRKIAQHMDYTQGILYHYFKNKDEILAAITKEGYQKIVVILQSAAAPEDDPQMALAKTLRAYMQGMLAQIDFFMIMMMSNHEEITAQVHILQEGISQERSSMKMLCAGIQAGIMAGQFTCEHVELRAQTIWCATFGLLMRIYKEEVAKEYQQALIDEHIEMILASLRAKR